MVRVYVLEGGLYFRLCVKYFSLTSNGTENLSLVSLASKHSWWILPEVSPGRRKNLKLRIKVCYSVTRKPDTTKSVNQIQS